MNVPPAAHACTGADLALALVEEDLGVEVSRAVARELVVYHRRQFDRAFVADTGQMPAKTIEKLRAEIARPWVKAGDESLEQAARAVGFADPERMRRAFIRVFGQPPQSVRRSGALGDTRGRSGHARLVA